ncbi:lipid-A-disaccharide synthase [Nitrosococcus halophilus Nc 4]|uniref:Lipid-A-disaccharide synthase n=1 Tax=Nitrosococcus halophilus (strain Nc4) TaxID=472759 RepID=D5BZU6_NITHN|nr:lipid-A-disaccharide synthase [Nitrosococcus halophilus]ADE14391.1 lipid-A-disaccharide synthase [Nitrosococcus halophilus Nc 4]
MENNTPLVAIVAGEASGDQHGAYLIREVKKMFPQVRFCGIAGPRMRAVGAEALFDSSQLAVVGLVEVLSHFKEIYRALQKMRRFLEEKRPDLLILVDYPEFNLRLAKTAKALGIKVLYYISPQIWAWRQHRVHRIRRLVDMMAVVLPFEVPFYEQAGVPVCFVGHPLRDEVKSPFSRDEAVTEFGFDPHRKTLGLLPGSRRSEIKRLLPILLDAAEQIYLQEPDIQYLLPLAMTLEEADLAPYLKGRRLPLKIIPNRSYDVMAACDAMVVASGTVTLEAALMGVPLVVIYKMKPLSYWIGRLLIRVNHIALCNIIAGEGIAPELIQQEASPEQIAREALSLLEDQDRVRAMQQKFRTIKDKLGAGAQQTIAELTVAMLRGEELNQQPNMLRN